MQYDRSTFRRAAIAHGHGHYKDVAAALGISPVTAWRLWTGKTAPSADVAGRVETAYGLPLSRLLTPNDTTCEAV
ncbi:helix-turn-helix domain-containing protein [Streptomyces sp. enrichment culture]|uniref:helix-turn-helix domain-containing protein n=1 Tax=Streptomyces sp. enrichment culture TaxID=1795815 RepID=UPI003F574AB4